jgi:hypothetical protein
LRSRVGGTLPIDGPHTVDEGAFVSVQIGIPALALTFILASAVLAAWFDTRFPKLAPTHVGYGFAHVLGAMVACEFLPAGIQMTAGRQTIGGMMAGLFFVALPVLLYLMLSLLWMTKLVTSELKGRYS